MSNARTKKYNKNRYRKVYQPVRALPIWGIKSDKEAILETLRVQFNNQDSIQFTLAGRYSKLPNVVISPMHDGDLGDVNLFISSISIGSVPSGGGKTVTVVANASVPFNGEALVQVVMI